MAIRRRGYRVGLFLVLCVGVASGFLLAEALRTRTSGVASAGPFSAAAAPAPKPMRAVASPSTLPQARQPMPAKGPTSPAPRTKQAPTQTTSITTTATHRTTASTFWQFSRGGQQAAPVHVAAVVPRQRARFRPPPKLPDSVGKAVTPLAPSSEANQEVGFVYVATRRMAARVRTERPPPPRRIVLAPTFPKVGSSWVFGVLEQLTGVVSAAVYNEAHAHDYTNEGTAGAVYTFQRLRRSNTELLQPHDSLIVKTHFPHKPAVAAEHDVEATRLLLLVRHPMQTVMSALWHYQRQRRADKVPLTMLPAIGVAFSAFMDKWNQSATALYAAGVPVMTVRVEDLCTDATGALWSQLLGFAGRSLRSGLTAVGDTECDVNRIMGGDRWEVVPPGVRSDVAGKVGKWMAQLGYTPL